MVQVLVILAQVVLVLVLAILWTTRDERAARKRSQIEPFWVLFGVFVLGVVMTFLLKGAVTLIMSYGSAGLVTEEWFWILTLFLEELVKVVALIIGLELAGGRFNELSDGVIYTVFAALGFVFFENLTYLLPGVANFEMFSALLIGRNLFSFAAHLFTAVFGVFYAFAYLFSKKGSRSRVKPWNLVGHVKILWKQMGGWIVIWLPFSPFVTLWKFFSKGLKSLNIPELLWSGFLMSAYLHVGYNLLLRLNNQSISSAVLFSVGLFIVGLWKAFPKLDVKVR